MYVVIEVLVRDRGETEDLRSKIINWRRNYKSVLTKLP